MALELLESTIFNALMLPLEGANAMLDLIENRSDYPSNHTNNIRRDQINMRVKTKQTELGAKSKKFDDTFTLYLISFFCPPIAVYIRRERFIDWHVVLNLMATFILLWPVALIHAIILITFTTSRSDRELCREEKPSISGAITLLPQSVDES